MHNSVRFKQLVKRLNTLRAHLLPVQFSPIGQYNDKEHDMARAYLVLVHAEIEAYCEDRSRSIATKAHRRWQNKNRYGRVLVNIMKYHNVSKGQPWKSLDKSATKVNSALNFYLGSVGKNHGVKEENLFKMLYPIGIHAADLDTVWLATMDSFGTRRGAVAHTSVSAQQPIDPATEYNRVMKQILPGLRKLDRKVSRL
jgi:hypothetical protein